MHILVTGGTGFIGTGLCVRLKAEGHSVTVLTRDPSRAQRHFAGRVPVVGSLSILGGDSVPDAIVNLAGENLAAHRSNERRKWPPFTRLHGGCRRSWASRSAKVAPAGVLTGISPPPWVFLH